MNPQVGRLAVDIARAANATVEVRAAVQVGAKTLRAAWRRNARATAGAHGKHYPNSITSETKFAAGAAEAEIGPDSSMPQGGMGRGFEYGSVNQPPHGDAAKAVAEVGPGVEEQIENAVAVALKRAGL